MIYGERQKFAIEYELEKNYGGEWLYGKVCYWINGSRIGDYDLGTSLRDVLFQAKYINHYAGSRDFCDFYKMDARDIFDVIDQSIYGFQKINDDAPLEEPARFDILFPIDIFDSYKAYLIEREFDELILYKNICTEEFHSFSLAKFYFNEVFRSFYLDIDILYSIEAK